MGGSSMCGVAGSPDSQAALGVVKKLAERLEARLVLARVAEVPVAPHAAGGMEAGRIAPQPMTLATRDDQEEAGARLLSRSPPSTGSVTPNGAWSSAFRPSDSPIWPTTRMPS